MCPERESDANIMAEFATSSGLASFFKDIVEVILSTRFWSIPLSIFSWLTVHPGAMALTLTPFPIWAASFFSVRNNPEVIAPLAAA